MIPYGVTTMGSSQGVPSKLQDWCFKVFLNGHQPDHPHQHQGSKLWTWACFKVHWNGYQADHQPQGSKLWTWAKISLSEHSEISCSQTIKNYKYIRENINKNDMQIHVEDENK